MLCDRKKRILQAIIDDYVSTAEPISSNTIAKKYDMGLSSATIRNEMADLEELGYLHQPHTSAGRIPSDKGYRLYVDELMIRKTLSQQEVESIKYNLLKKINAMEKIMQQASTILSQITHYTTVVKVPLVKNNIIKHVQIVPLDSNNALLVLIYGTGIIKNTLIKLPETLNNEVIIKTSNLLNEKLHGLTIESINLPIIQDIQNEMGNYKDILMPILDIIATSIEDDEENEVYYEGTSNIFDYPEYNSIEKAKNFINAIEEKDIISKLLGNSNESIKISIGKENYIEQMDECSLVSTTYSVGDRVIGTVGIIGPKRMDYPKVVSSINVVRQQLYDIFEDWLFK